MHFDLVFTDCETTGLDPEKDEMIELAVVRVDSRTLEEKARFHRYFLPTVPVSPEVRAVNGYDEALWMERGARLLCPADLHELDMVLTGAAFAGQNVTFDRDFVRGGYASIGRAMPPMDYHLIDVTSLVWPFVVAGVLPGMSHKYSRQLRGLSGAQSHSALGDITETLDVYGWVMALYVWTIGKEAIRPIESMSASAAMTHVHRTGLTEEEAARAERVACLDCGAVMKHRYRSSDHATALGIAQRLANATGRAHEVRDREGVLVVTPKPETP